MLWHGARYGTGYGQQRWRGIRTGAHRVAWMREHGPIPDGLEIDHKCNVPLCVNVEHLQLVTHRENIQLRETRPGVCKAGKHPKAGLGKCQACRKAYEQTPAFKESVKRWEAMNREKRRAYQREWKRGRTQEPAGA